MRLGYAVAVLMLCVAPAAALAASSVHAKPTVELCLRAWNAPANASDRVRLAAAGLTSASLHTGVVGKDIVRGGKLRAQSSVPACLILLIRTATLQQVTGVWSRGTVSKWQFADPIRLGPVRPPANVRVTPDGRISLL